MMASAFNLVAITVERYFKVVHPIAHRVSFTRRKALITIFLVWLLGWFYMLASNLATSRVVNGACVFAQYPSYAAKQTVNVIHFLLQYLGPICVFVFCYTKMAVVLRQGQFKTAPATATSEAARGHANPMKASSKKAVRNIIKTMFVVSVAFFICFSPNQWLFFLFSFGIFDYRVFSNPIYNISVIAIYLNCCVNPVIYVASYEQFQNALRRLLCPHATAKVGVSINDTATGGVAPSAVR
jgi:7 transmembrane receptor (rhodopsin family)